MNDTIIAMILIMISILMLYGCANKTFIPSKCPRIELPKEMEYPVYFLKNGDMPDKVMKSYVATVKGQRQYIEQVKYLVGD